MNNAKLILPPSSFIPSAKRVTDGTRTRDVQDHNLALYQLSYGHRVESKFIALLPHCVNRAQNSP